MATLKEKIAAERQARSVIESGGLPAPDRVEYGHTCIWLLWNEQRVALEVVIDEAGEPDFREEAA